jgi:hypothetical protein
LNSRDWKANAWTRSAEDTELNDAVLSVLAHELGGIAGALDLRAAALARTIPPNDVAALRGLAEEVRASTRAVRLLRGADASGTLNPSRQPTLNDWWRLASKVSRVVLPSRTVVNATFDESRLNVGHQHTLTWVWLAACKDLAEAQADEAAAITLRGMLEAGMISFRAEVPGVSVPPSSRWTQHAATLAASIEAESPRWDSQAGVVSWSFSLPAVAV